MIVGLLAWRFSAFHIVWNGYKVRSLECFYKSIEFGLPNLANIVGSPFIASPFRNSQNCGRFASPSFRLKIHPHQLHLQLNLNSLFMEVSLRPCEIWCLGRWGITHSTPSSLQMAEFNVYYWVTTFPANHGDAKNEEKCFISTTDHSILKKQRFVGCIPGCHQITRPQGKRRDSWKRDL